MFHVKLMWKNIWLSTELFTKMLISCKNTYIKMLITNNNNIFMWINRKIHLKQYIVDKIISTQYRGTYLS